MATAGRVASLRKLFPEHSISGFVVPSQDAHNSEYIADHDKRRAFISGFTGSAGTAVITNKNAALWADGRYWTQASQQLDETWELMKDGDTPRPPTPQEWLLKVLDEGSSLGVDPFVTTVGTFRRYEKEFGDTLKVQPLDKNLVDEVWENQPPAPKKPIIVHPVKYSGESTDSKLKSLRSQLEEEKCYAILVSALDEICWLLNIRGSDIDYNPVVMSYVLVTTEKTFLFVDQEKVTDECKEHLQGIEIRPYNSVVSDLESLMIPDDKKVWMDVATCNLAVYRAIPKNSILEKTSPIPLKKAIKNETEIEGFRNSHVRDGAAKTAWLAWLGENLTEENKDGLTEVTVADKLEEYRSKQDLFVGLSFPSISGSGANGAIIHYGPTTENCAVMDRNQMYLIDSGAQYRDGTTDVTRTIHLGNPTDHEKECFTRVLKGHIGLASVIFPEGTTGPKMDIFARSALWDVGLDYPHGTGHGVGSYLNVHEGPHGISASSRRTGIENTGIVAGMTATNEPGYYEDGKFGIRIETLMIARESKTRFNFQGKKFLEWETVTFVPLQKSLMAMELLNDKEVNWINDYHKECLEKLSPLLKDDARALKFLEESCKPIERWSVNVNMIS